MSVDMKFRILVKNSSSDEDVLSAPRPPPLQRFVHDAAHNTILHFYILDQSYHAR